MSARHVALALLADVVAVLVFAAVGRASHDEAGAVLGVLATAGPFLAGTAVAWVTPWVRARPGGATAGAVVLAATVVLGLALRTVFTGRLPLTFVLVTVVALAVPLLGWRGVARAAARLAAARAAG